MSELVYVADWQIQCCGEEFATGDQVVWPVVPTDPSDPSWESFLGYGPAAALTGSYESHEDEPLPQVAGTVLAIRTVSCRYAPPAPPADVRTPYPVPGTTVFERVEAIDQWYGTDAEPGGLTFCGWLVELEVSP